MKAAVLRRATEVVIEDREIPQCGPDQVLVKVTAVGVCGSDVHYYQHGRIGSFVVSQPMILGHEAGGVIAAVGSNVTDRQVGQRVSLEPGVPDFTCEQCLAGRYNLCPNVEFFATPPYDGAFAEYVAIHRAFAHPVPETLSDEAAALIEPLSVAVWACRKAGVQAGTSVLVTGAGPIGLLCLQVALAVGASSVVVSDVSPERLAVATTLGASAVVDARTEQLPGPLGAPQVLLECSGAAPVVSQGIAALAPAGRAVLIGMGADEVSVPVSAVQSRELTVTGTFRYAGTWPASIALAASGRVQLDALVTHRFGLAESEQALTVAQRDGSALKAVVCPQQ